MYKYRKIISIAAGLLILFGTMAFGGISKVRAIEPGIYEVAGNPTCATLYTLHADLYDLGPLLGFKYDSNPTGYLYHTFTDEGYWKLEDFTPSDPNNWVEISNVNLNSDGEGYIFDWASSLGIDAVIVKAQDALAYVYYPEEFGDEGLTAPNLQGVSHISFCYDYELDVEKTATAEFTRTYEWEIFKDYDATYDLLAGGSVDHDYLVTVDKTGFTDSDFKVTGTITVKNNTPFNGVAYTVTDKVGTNTAMVTCPQPQELDSGEFAECTYSVDLLEKMNGTNIATVTTTHAFVQGEKAEAAYVFGEPTTKVNDTINVSDTNDPNGLGSASGFKDFDYSKTFECSADPAYYTNGFYKYDHTNTATIDETGQSDDATVTINCYAPVVTKTADEYFTRYWDWDIEKVDDGDYDRFISESVEHNYKVSVTPATTDNDWQVKGTITVTNSHPTEDMVLTSLSDLAGGISAVVTCPSMTVPAAGKLDCTYETYKQNSQDVNPFGNTNTATAVFAGSKWIGTAPISFPTTPTSEVGKKITVDDDNLSDEVWSADGAYAEWTYKKTFTCSLDPGDYEDGNYTITNTNTATINETGEVDTATVTVDCYAPVVSKTAVGTYDLRYTWDVDKIVTPLDQSGYPGDTLSWTWTVDVSESSAPENYAINGVITVVNNHPTEAMTVSIADVLDDGTPVTLACGGSLTVPAAGSNTCAYSAAPDDDTATKNTVTATFKEIPFIYDATVSFNVDKTYNGTANIADDMESDFPLKLIAGEGIRSWTETGSHTCSSDATAYDAYGKYGYTLYNTVTITGSYGQSDSANASTTYLCEAGFVDLLKLTNGEQDQTMVWNFKLYTGGFGVNEIGSDSTPPALLDFGNPALRPDTTYTICELGIPAGYTSFWSLDLNNDEIFDNGDIVLSYVGGKTGNLWEVYDPTFGIEGAVNDTRCVDFKVNIGQTTHFLVDNQMGGGEPRTIGYWKNWAYCTGGGQYATAKLNGGAEKGWWTLDDLLPQWVGLLELKGLPVIEGEKITISEYSGDYCDVIGIPAINILNKSTLDGSKMANDAAYELAAQMLATKLNLSAGACVPTADDLTGTGYASMNDMLAAADALLVEIEVKKNTYVPFDGLGSFLGPKNKSPQRAEAFWLATLFDNYNNAEYCTGDPTH